MKKVVIMFGPSDWKKSSPPKDPKYRGCYEYMYELARKEGIQLFRASISWLDMKNKTFKHAWTFTKKKGWTREKNVKPSLISNKMSDSQGMHGDLVEIAQKIPLINNPFFGKVVNNKFSTYLLFKEFMPRTFYILNRSDLKKATKKIKSNKIVLKPLSASGAEGIKIIKKGEVEKSRVNKEYIAQEFIETGAGIKGITNERHDLRLTFINDKLIYAYIRTPAKGSLFATVSKGGEMTIVPLDKLPKSIKPILKRIEFLFSDFDPRIYTLDLMFGPGQKPYVVEMNSRPGIYFYQSQKKWMDKFYKAIIEQYRNH